jgi:hypothetical protein
VGFYRHTFPQDCYKFTDETRLGGFMKDVITLVVIMAMFSMTVFAAPLSVVRSFDKISQEEFRT